MLKLMGPLFEILKTCSLLHLSVKVVFVVAIISSRRAGELRVLVLELPYTGFHKSKVYFCPHPKFLKVVSNCHINQSIYFLTFFPKPSFVWCEKSFSFHLDRTRSFRSSIPLFVAVADRDQPVSTHRISSGISSCIHLCYQLANVTPAPRMLARSTRA